MKRSRIELEIRLVRLIEFLIQSTLDFVKFVTRKVKSQLPKLTVKAKVSERVAN